MNDILHTVICQVGIYSSVTIGRVTLYICARPAVRPEKASWNVFHLSSYHWCVSTCCTALFGTSWRRILWSNAADNSCAHRVPRTRDQHDHIELPHWTNLWCLRWNQKDLQITVWDSNSRLLWAIRYTRVVSNICIWRQWVCLLLERRLHSEIWWLSRSGLPCNSRNCCGCTSWLLPGVYRPELR